MPNSNHAAVVDKLLGMPRGEIVRVVVQAEQPKPDAQPLDPKDFASSVEYRSALIQQHRTGSQTSTALVQRKACEMGLRATPASNLNAVTVEGAPGRIADLLATLDLSMAVLERPLVLGPLPRPI